MSNINNYIVKINNGLFLSSLTKGSKPVFPKRIPNFQINSNEKWAICGTGKAKLMNILSNKYLGDPSRLALRYSSTTRHTLPRIETIQFSGAIPTAHLSARYEYFKDEFDQTCKQFILNNSIGSNNVSYDVILRDDKINENLYEILIKELQLSELQDRWAMGLSNGQMRRARLARSLLKEPDLLLVDDPFLGLDPTATSIISKFLSQSEKLIGTPITIGLRYQDSIPKWCTHVCFVDENQGILFNGIKKDVEIQIKEFQEIERKKIQKVIENQHINSIYTIDDLISLHPMYKNNKNNHETIKIADDTMIKNEIQSMLIPAIEFKGINVTYRGEPVLQDLKWSIQPGSKWHVRGNNGSGKSTLLSMIVAEHPQSWNKKIIENGIERKTGQTSYFKINSKIGMSSPELHAIFAKRGNKISVLESISSGFHEGSSNNFLPMWDKLSNQQRKLIKMYMDHFSLTLIKDKKFDELNVSQQKLVLFIRSLIKMPETLILDEAFSGMQDTEMIRCYELLDRWPGTVLIVAHILEETPHCDHYIRLITPGNYEIGDVSN
ncbi:similar to Saccharomyces cerevisiae YDR061W Protein with similarity to ATP-binding cassette (ABC) transporter family members [Maudiozyma saulgeensis]|uniref:Similar to Saccharomyces cerevisiae YDR061W Protein with similarity to ATP-binding cassette (ABC) transporter family members n=1 Tax=Maudiozyma saulgeensis TaxID=1789683 RepID=A0A1X7QYF5_9SACH|nr:similar to Saccharomyces cerevisiae YDR061W Protein with similarity to ATP-binding cassette (ABC) transporter family members [Kazachstania saulgeensis]